MKYLPILPALILFLVGAVVATEWVDRHTTNALERLTKWPRAKCQRITVLLMLSLSLGLVLVLIDLLASLSSSRT